MKLHILVVVVILSLSTVIAQHDTDEIDNAGITPDSIFYGLDIAIERVRLAFTFGDENKINYGLEKADERLNEVREMIHENKLVEANDAEERRQESIEKAKEKALESEDDLLIEKVKVKLGNHIIILNEILITAPEEAKEGLRIAIEKSTKERDKVTIKVNDINTGGNRY